jgi:hypothetical protein
VVSLPEIKFGRIDVGCYDGTQSAYGIARNKAWAAASVGLGTGLGDTELVSGFMAMILARSGLL